MFNEAPAAQAQKKNENFIKLEPLPADGQQIMTIVATNYIPEYVNPFAETDEDKAPYPAVEFYLGTLIDSKAYFIKTTPVRYSTNEKANYTKIYQAALGKAPTGGSKASELHGAGVTVEVETKDKVSKKGTQYRVSKARNFTSVHPKLKSEIVEVGKLLPALTAIVEAGKKPDNDGNPY